MSPKAYMMSTSSRSIFVTSILALGLGLAGTSAQAAEADAPTTRVLNGETVPECGFAPVAYLGNCTGTLVHPEIVLHAQHCGKPRRISLTHGGAGGKRLDVEYCKTYPGKWDTSQDFAFCKLKTPVTDIPPIPVAFGCETEEIKKGAEIVHCGFGANGGSGSGNKGAGIKRWGANTIGNLAKKGEFTTINTSPSKIVSCAGDSGGPLLMRMKDKSWRLLGVASTINGGGCSGSRSYNSYSLAAPGIAWVEKESGVDITPCFEPDGTWKPTKDCGKFYMGDQEGHGSWKDGCKGTPVSGYSSTCGDPFGDGEGQKSGESESSSEGGDSSSSDSESEGGESGSSDSEEKDPSQKGDSANEDDTQSEDASGETQESATPKEEDESLQDDSAEESDPQQEESSEPTSSKSGCAVQGSSGHWAIGAIFLGLGLFRLRRRA